MSERPTPETDSVAEKINFGVDIDFARKLERERDEAREAIQYAIDSYKKVKWGYDGCCGTSVIMEKLQDFLSKEAK